MPAHDPLPPTTSSLVLVADDDVDTRIATAELLVDHGYWPVTVRNGLEALELLRRGARPAAMVIDLRMPLMDGAALCSACDEEPEVACIPRILISSDEDALKQTRPASANEFLAKPIDGDRLLGALRHLARDPVH